MGAPNSGCGFSGGKGRFKRGICISAVVTAALLCGGGFTMASTVVTWGNPSGTVLPSELTDAVSVNSGVFRGAAIKASGEIVWWGSFFGTPHPPTPPSGAVAVSLGGQFGLALSS